MMKKPVTHLLLSVLLVGAAVVFAATTLRKRADRKESFHFYENPKNEEVVSPAIREAWKDLAGFWEGAIRFNDDDDDGLRLIYRITERYGEVLSYTLDQGGGLIPATGANFDPETNK